MQDDLARSVLISAELLISARNVARHSRSAEEWADAARRR
jgi:hypothetical protein